MVRYQNRYKEKVLLNNIDKIAVLKDNEIFKGYIDEVRMTYLESNFKAFNDISKSLNPNKEIQELSENDYKEFSNTLKLIYNSDIRDVQKIELVCKAVLGGRGSASEGGVLDQFSDNVSKIIKEYYIGKKECIIEIDPSFRDNTLNPFQLALQENFNDDIEQFEYILYYKVLNYAINLSTSIISLDLGNLNFDLDYEDLNILAESLGYKLMMTKEVYRVYKNDNDKLIIIPQYRLNTLLKDKILEAFKNKSVIKFIKKV